MRITPSAALAAPLLLVGVALGTTPLHAQQVLSFTQTAGVNNALGNPFVFNFGGGISATATAYRLAAGLLSNPVGAEAVSLATQGSTAAVPLNPGAAFNSTGLGLRCTTAGTACPTLNSTNQIGSGYAVVLDFGANNVGRFDFSAVGPNEGAQLYSSPTFQSSFGLWNLVGAGFGPNIAGTEILRIPVVTPQQFYLVTAGAGDMLILDVTVPTSPVPEPSTGVLAMIALMGLGTWRVVARRGPSHTA